MQGQPGRRHDQAGDGGGILEQDRLHRGVLARGQEPAQRLLGLARLRLDLLVRTKERNALGDQRHREDHIGHHEAVLAQPVGDQIVDSLDDGEHGSRHEDDHCGQKRPEEPLLSVSERVVLRGPAL